MRIKSFDELTKGIKESLDSPIDIKWNKLESDWIGTFQTDKNEYNIIIQKQKYDIWKYKFFFVNNDKLSIKMTNYNYDTFKVLATIYKSLFDFLDEIKPNGIIFGADNDSPTRIKLYTKFSNECVEKYDYILYEKSYGDKVVNPTIYVLYHKLNPNELLEVIKIVIDSELKIE